MYVMSLCRLGSINKLIVNRTSRIWTQRGWGELASARTVARSARACDLDSMRTILCGVYKQMKRRKGLSSPFHSSLFALIVDGHECFCSNRRKWRDCLTRRIAGSKGEPTQSYCRVVTAVLLCKDFVLLLDVEIQRVGEGETACASRLFKRIMANYPKAFDVVCADGLYAQQPFIRLVRKHHKHCIVVLKDQRRDLMVEARKLFASNTPTQTVTHGRVQRQIWDCDVDAWWAQTRMCIRVVRSREISYVIRQNGGKREEKISDWIWATTIPRQILPAVNLVTAGHRRWDIENKCFNELANSWHINHAYTHDCHAVQAFWLLTMIAYNIFHAFYWFNLKPSLRQCQPKTNLADTITAAFYCYEGG